MSPVTKIHVCPRRYDRLRDSCPALCWCSGQRIAGDPRSSDKVAPEIFRVLDDLPEIFYLCRESVGSHSMNMNKTPRIPGVPLQSICETRDW